MTLEPTYAVLSYCVFVLFVAKHMSIFRHYNKVHNNNDSCVMRP